MSDEGKKPKEWTAQERESELLAAYKQVEAKLEEAETRGAVIDKDRKVLTDEVEELRKQNAEMLAKLGEALKGKNDNKTPLGTPLGDEKKGATFKVVIAGCPSVGKTCLAHYFTHGVPSMEHGPTHGAKYTNTLWYLEKKAIQLQICDTQGDKPGRHLLGPYVRSVDAILMVFDINQLETLQELEQRFGTIIEEARVEDPVVFILGNKVDTLTGERAEEFVSVLQKLLQSIKSKMLEHHREGEVLPFLSYYEVSAKTGNNCKEVLQQLELQIAYRKVFGKPALKTPGGRSLDDKTPSRPVSSCCK